MSANDNLAFDTKTVVESRDNILPTMISAAIDYSTGVLVIFASETIDADASNHPATSGNPIVLVEKLRISQVTGSDVNAPAALDVVLTGAGVAVKEALSLTVTLTEQQRVDAIAISATPGGDGTGNAFTPRNCVGGTSAAASYTEDADGQLCVSNGGVYTPNACSGGGDATSHSLCTGSVVLDVFADAMQDIGQNKNIDAAGNRNLLVVETADTIPPTIVSSTLNLGTGVLTITADEYIDATPSANFDLDKIRICDKSGVYTNAVNEDLPCIHIVGAQITETDGYTITLQITERQRANAIAISATPGGDGTGNTFAPRHCVGGTSAAAPYTEDADGQLCVDNGGVYTPNACSGGGDATSHSSCTGSLVLDALAGAVQDVGTVNNLDNLNIPIVETPDTIDPVINSCEIDYNNGYVRINTSEIIDVTPSGSTVDLTKLKLVNAAGDDISTSISTFPNFGPPSNDAANLVGSNITDADNEWIELIIPELARSLANQFGGVVIGGDGDAAKLDASVGALADVAGNQNLNFNGLNCSEVADEKIPILQSGVVNYGTGVLVLTFDETIDVSPSSLVNFDNVFLTDALSSFGSAGDLNALPAPPHFVLTGSTLQNVEDVTTITLKYTELQRVTAILHSGTKGNNGDDTAMHVRLDAAFVEDTGTNANGAQTPIQLTEVEDAITPVVQSATLDYNDGTLVILSSETIDSTPTTKVDPSKIFVSDTAGEFRISLRGATVLQAGDSMDKNVVTIRLTEAQRIGAMELSGEVGDTTGLGTAVVVDLRADALVDVATNGIDEQTGIAVTETADTTKPTITSATITYVDNHPPGRLLRVLCSETIDASAITLANIFIVNAPGDNDASNKLALQGASVVQTDDQPTFTVVLTETQRVFALALSNTPGGDGTGAILLDFDADGVRDIGTNANLGVQGVSVQETPDTNAPKVISASLTLGNGYLSIVHSETVDALPKENLNLNLVSLVQSASDSLTGGTGSGTIASAEIQDLVGATTINGESGTVVIHLTESQRDRAIRASATPGGDGTGFTFTAAKCTGGTQNADPYTRDADGTLCTAAGGTFSYSEPKCVGGTAPANPYYADTDGAICVAASGVFAAATAKCTGGNSNADPYTEDSDGSLCQLRGGTFAAATCVDSDGADQGTAAAASSAACTGSIVLEVAQAAIKDMGLQDLDQSLGIVVSETADTTKMLPTAAALDMNTGVLTLTFSEHVRTYMGPGQTGDELFDLTKLDVTQLSTVPGFTLTTGVEAVAEGNVNMIISEFALDSFNLYEATSVSNVDLSDTVTIQLTEKQRAIAVQMSACPSGNYDGIFGASGTAPLDGYTNGDATFGGDGSQLRLHFYDSAFKDVALTGNSEMNDLLVTETCDVNPPIFTSAEIHYGLGYVILRFSETVDITPEGMFDLSNIFIVDETGDRSEPDAVPLAGAMFNTSDDSASIFLTLTESQRISALLISGTPGGDGTSGKIDAASPLMRDLQGNLNLQDSILNLSMYEIPDEVSPSIKSAIINYNTGLIQIHLSEKILENFWHMGNMSISSVRDVDPDTATVLTNIRLVDDDTTATVAAVYASDVSVTAADRSAHINITLSESQRVRAIAISSTPGGDGTSLIFTPSACSNNAAHDANQSACEGADPAGTWTPNVCKDAGGVPQGDSTSKISCEGEAAYFQAPMFASKLGSWQTGSGFTDVSNNPNLKFPSLTGYSWTDSSCSIPQYHHDKYKCLASAFGGVGIFVDARCDDGDGNALRIDGNGIAASQVLCEGETSEVANAPMTEIGDTTRPTISKVTLDLNADHPTWGQVGAVLRHQATLVIRHSEYIDQSPNSLITDGFLQDVYQLRQDANGGTVADITQSNVVDIAAHGGAYVPEPSGASHAPSFIGDGYELKFILTEAQRVRLIQLSGTPGGDSSVLQLRVPENTYKDVAQNNVVGVDAFTVTEIADIVGPTLLTCAVNLSDGFLIITAAEYIDADPDGNVDPSKAFLADTSGVSGFTWTSAATSSCSDGTNGGDLVTCVGLTGGKFVPEVASRCSNNPDHDANQGSCEAGSGVFYPTVPKRCATCTNGGDPSSILACSGQTGYTFNLGPPSTCTDAQGANVGSAANQAACEGTVNGNTYTADDHALDSTSQSSCEGVATGHTYSPATPNLCKDNAGVDKVGSPASEAACEGGHLSGQPTAANAWAGASLNGATTFAVEGPAFSVKLTEAQRVRAIRISADAASGGDGVSAVLLEAEPGFVRDIGTNLNLPLSSMTCTETPDTIAPVIQTVNLYLQVGTVAAGLNYGKVVFTTSETVYSASVDVAKIIFVNDAGPVEEYSLDSDGGATVVTQTTEDGDTIELQLTELQRVHLIALSGTSGGDTSAVTAKFLPSALTDVAKVGNLAQDNIAVVEHADNIAPIMIASALVFDLGDGTANITMSFDETIDTMIGNCDNNAAFHNDQASCTGTWTESTGIMLAKLSIANTSPGATGLNKVSLVGATINTALDGFSATVTLTEAQRTTAIAFNGFAHPAGGDGTPVLLDVEAGAFVDVARNEIAAQLGFAVAETQDTRRPQTTRAQLDLGTGVLTVRSDEYIDLTPLSDLDAAKLALVDDVRDNASVLAAFDVAMTGVLAVGAGAAYESFATVLLDGNTTVLAAPGSTCSGHGIQGLSEQGCTGMTGNTWTAPKCVGGSEAADPYSVDTGITGNDAYDGKKCTDGGGTYTAPSCTNSGNPESEGLCEGIQLGTCATSGSNDDCAAASTEAACSAATLSGGAGVGANACVFTGNVFTAAGPDGYVFTARLSEIQRVRAITLSAEAGGKHTTSTAQYLRLAQGVYTDVAQNENAALITESTVLLVEETADNILPVVLSAEIHYGEFWLKVRFSETIDSTPGESCGPD